MLEGSCSVLHSAALLPGDDCLVAALVATVAAVAAGLYAASYPALVSPTPRLSLASIVSFDPSLSICVCRLSLNFYLKIHVSFARSLSLALVPSWHNHRIKHTHRLAAPATVEPPLPPTPL